jgi:hypothetical protein
MMNFKYITEISSPVKSILYSNFKLSDYRLAVVLNSRQSKTPCGNDTWVINSKKAITDAINNNYTVITSIGMNTWELTCNLCARYGGRQVIICPIVSEKDIDSIIHSTYNDFELDTTKASWLFFKSPAKSKSSKASWPIRDKISLNLADTIMPVSLRPNGNLLNLMNKYIGNESKTITDKHRVAYTKSRKYHNQMPMEVDRSLENESWSYITHWTRTCYGHWPKQTKSTFYKKLVDSGECYPNTAYSTLANILHRQTIYASSSNYRKGNQGVSFSGSHPKDVLSLMHWRKRYARWNFEPYGISIARKTAISLGVNPVIYGKPSMYDKLTDKDKPFFQSIGVDGGNWRAENEWRYISDFSIKDILPDNMIVIVRKPEEIEPMRKITKSKVVSFT